jgi:2-hydroxy-3-oxopropionate reductase
VVHNRTRTKAEQLAQHGARVADSPREVAEASDVVITMLPGPPEVEEVVAGEDGLLEGATRGSLIIDMSTSSPLLARQLAHAARERGVGMLDAPVSGGDIGARDGTLSIMVGGEEDDFEGSGSLFKVMGETVVHVGGTGAGQVVKTCNQKVLEILSGGLASSKVLEVKGEKFLSHEFSPGGKVEYHRKDLRIALAAGREYGVTLPVAALVEQMFGVLVAKGRGGWDHSALLTLIEEGSR